MLVFLPLYAIGDTYSDTENPYINALPAWKNILSEYVDEEGRTDFIALASNIDELKIFVDAIAEVSPKSHPDLFTSREAILSYHINAYNALAMYGVIERDIPDNFSSFFKRLSFFKLRGVTIGGKSTDLYTYENKVIRKFDEPRLHFALNCMVRDCPRLPQEAFEPNTLDSTLDALTREFLSKPKYIRVNHDKRTVHLSYIFKLYPEDFVESGKVKDLIPYVNRYVKPEIPSHYKVKIMDYDWTVNQQPK